MSIRLGSLALKSGMVSAEQLKQALSIQAREAARGKLSRQLGLILLSEGYLDEAQLVRLIGRPQELRRPRT